MNTSKILLLLLLLLVEHKVLACGGVIHNEVGRRALEFLDNEEIAYCAFNFPEAFQSAAIFPDWGYNSDSTSDASEHSHWPEFSRIFADHISKKYKKPWDEQGQRVVAFYLGISVHSTSDVLWHDLSNINQNIGQGFIRSQAQHIFDGDYQYSHTVADVGGEFVGSYELDTNYLRRLWYIPIDDIIEVYREGKYDVSSTDIIKGSLLLFASTQAASELGHILYPLTSISPFLQEEMYRFFSGGIDDMVYWTLECWNNSISLLNDIDVSPCSIFHDIQSFSHHNNGLIRMPFWKKIILSLISQAEIKKIGGELYIKFAPKLPVKITKEDIRELISYTITSNGYNLEKQLEQLFDDGNGGFEVNFDKDYRSTVNTLNDKCTYIDKGNATKISTKSKYSYLGSQVIYGNLTGSSSTDIIISAPGFSTKSGWERGAVYIIPSIVIHKYKDISLDNPPPGIIQLLGQHKYGRFGESMAIVDLNGDGIDDLAISSPRVDAENHKYSGIISIFYGTKQGISLSPSVTIFSNTTFSNIGTELKGIDLDGDGKNDLIIGSPYSCNLEFDCKSKDPNLQRGSVSIFLSSKWNQKVKGLDEINIVNSDWVQYGQSGYGWFGYKIEYLRSKKILAISAPTAMDDDDQIKKGLVYGFSIKDILGSIKSKPYWTIKGDSSISKFGFDLSSGNPFNNNSLNIYLSLSMPTYASIFSHGAVRLIDLDNMKSAYTTYGSNYFSRFGWKTLLNDIDSDGYDDFLISEPWYNDQTGRLLIWKGGKEFGNSEEADICYTISDMKNSLFGMNFNVYNSKYLTYLTVSSPRYSETNEMSGAVFIISY